MPSSDTQFQGKGVGTKHGEAPISIRFSSKVRALLKQMPNAQDYVRQAVEEKLWIDNLPSMALASKLQLPKTSCVYMAIDSQGVVQYVGRSTNLLQRWANHHKHDDLTKMEGVRIAYLAVDETDLLPVIEKALIEWFTPPLNQGLGGGRPSKYNATKIERKIRITDEGWEGLRSLSVEVGLPARADLIEQLGRRQLEVVSPHPKTELACNERVEAAIATVLPTVPLRDRAIVAKAFKKLVAHLKKTD